MCALVFCWAAIGPTWLIDCAGDADVGWFDFWNVFGEVEFETIWCDVDGGDVEWSAAVVSEALQAFGEFTPTADGLSDVELFAIGRENMAIVSRSQARAAQQIGCHALVNAIDFFDHDAAEGLAVVIWENELPREIFSERAISGNHDWLCSRTTKGMRK